VKIVDRNYSSHHTVPRSRGGKKETVMLPKAFHDAWHCLFDNLYDEEIETFVREIGFMMLFKKKITKRELHELRETIKAR